MSVIDNVRRDKQKAWLQGMNPVAVALTREQWTEVRDDAESFYAVDVQRMPPTLCGLQVLLAEEGYSGPLVLSGARP